MPSIKRIIIPITGEQAGREILLDLARWSDNIDKERDAMDGRRTRKELSDMLYGLQTNDDVKLYDEYRAIQEFLHELWRSSISINQSSTIAWLNCLRELELVSLAAKHDDALLDDFKPRRYMEWQTLLEHYGHIERNATWSQSQCSLVKLISDELKLPELCALQKPLMIENLSDANKRIEGILVRLDECALDGAKELAGFIEKLPPINLAPALDPDVLRRAKAAMKRKKPLSERIMLARDVLFGAAA